MQYFIIYTDLFQRLKENDVTIPLVNNSPCIATVTLSIWRTLPKQILCTCLDKTMLCHACLLSLGWSGEDCKPLSLRNQLKFPIIPCLVSEAGVLDMQK